MTFHGVCASGRAISVSLKPAFERADNFKRRARREDVVGHPHGVHPLFRQKTDSDAASWLENTMNLGKACLERGPEIDRVDRADFVERRRIERERFDVALSKIRPTRPYLSGEATLRPADDIVRAIDTGNECRSIHQGWQRAAAAEADFEHAI